jgi:hypothetical protein
MPEPTGPSRDSCRIGPDSDPNGSDCRGRIGSPRRDRIADHIFLLSIHGRLLVRKIETSSAPLCMPGAIGGPRRRTIYGPSERGRFRHALGAVAAEPIVTLAKENCHCMWSPSMRRPSMRRAAKCHCKQTLGELSSAGDVGYYRRMDVSGSLSMCRLRQSHPLRRRRGPPNPVLSPFLGGRRAERGRRSGASRKGD